MTFRFSILTPDGRIFDRTVNKINVDTLAGQLTILPNHIPLLTMCKENGKLTITYDKTKKTFVITKGILQVKEEETVIIADEIKEDN